MLRSAGYRVSANDQPLDRFLGTLPRPDAMALVIALPVGAVPEPAARGVTGFLAAGGRLLLLAEHDDIYGNGAIANRLVGEAAIAVASGRLPGVRHPRFSPGEVAVGHSRALGVDSAVLYLAAPLTKETSDAVALLADDAGRPLALGAASGSGRVVLVGDAEFLWNGTPAFGLRMLDNQTLLLGTVRWLVGRGARRAGAASAGVVPPGGVAAFETGDDDRFGAAPDGYAAAPLPVSQTDEADDPALPLLAAEGIRRLPGIVRDSDTGRRTTPRACHWGHAAIVTVPPEDARWVRMRASGSAERYILPFVTAGRRLIRGTMQRAPAGGWPMVVATPRRFIVASGAPLSNAHRGNACFTQTGDLMAQWIVQGGGPTTARRASPGPQPARVR